MTSIYSEKETQFLASCQDSAKAFEKGLDKQVSKFIEAFSTVNASLEVSDNPNLTPLRLAYVSLKQKLETSEKAKARKILRAFTMQLEAIVPWLKVDDGKIFLKIVSTPRTITIPENANLFWRVKAPKANKEPTKLSESLTKLSEKKNLDVRLVKVLLDTAATIAAIEMAIVEETKLAYEQERQQGLTQANARVLAESNRQANLDANAPQQEVKKVKAA